MKNNKISEELPEIKEFFENNTSVSIDRVFYILYDVYVYGSISYLNDCEAGEEEFYDMFIEKFGLKFNQYQNDQLVFHSKVLNCFVLFAGYDDSYNGVEFQGVYKGYPTFFQ